MLRELAGEDVPAWFERASDPVSSALSGDPIPKSIETCFQWLELHRARFEEQKGIRWAIVPIGLSASVGSIGLTVIPEAVRTAELGAVVARRHWYKGFGTCAARLVTQYAFDNMGLRQIQADFLRSNLASKRVLEKLGFQLDRTVPNYRPSASGTEDGYLYVLKAQDGGAA